MRVWTTSAHNIFLTKGFAILVFFVSALTPVQAFASVRFTEVMYDAPGSDSGREWIEVTNTGPNVVDLYGYKLFESGVNHGLSVSTGTTTLRAGESAVIAANVQKFNDDYPTYTGTIFKSSFSLTNVGESVALKDKALSVVDSLQYSSGLGAAGDGNSLHLSGSRWVPGTPNPGSDTPTVAIAKKAAVVSASKAKTSTKKSAARSGSASLGVSDSDSGMYNQLAASPLGALPVPTIPTTWLYMLGLAALISLGVGSTLYIKPVGRPQQSETTEGSEEFTIV